MKNKLKVFIIIAGLILAVFTLSADDGSNNEKSDLQKYFKDYTTALAIIESRYSGEVDFEELVGLSIQRMLQTLDPHSSYADPKAFARMQEDQTGYFYGIGITISIRNQRTTVISVVETGPSYRLGLRAGDMIDSINGKSTAGLSLNEAVSMLRGPEGEPVTITVRRQGMSEPLKFEIIREKIVEEAVPYYFMFDDKTGYIKLERFSKRTERDMIEAIESLKKQNMKQLVLDLRDNPGGLLTQAIDVSNMFVDKGLIVSVKGRDQRDMAAFSAKKEALVKDMPLVVIVNENSASGAEIVAGAIQDHDRGILIGESTFGKGLVQTIFRLNSGGAVYLTTARYYTPSGRLIQREYTGIYDYYVGRRLNEGNSEIPKGEVFKTDAGRPIYSGQGISPDYELEQKFTVFLGRLVTKSLIYNFAGEFVRNNPDMTKSMDIDDKVLNKFKEYLKKNEFEFTDKEFEENIDGLKYRLADDIFTRRWDRQTGVQHAIKFDKQFQKGLELFKEARNLLKQPKKK
ncbi:MAG: S41 family peptidase [Acidobacteria bacterium]|nr:S41 family peptidase [Acidobacteriota bacterium]